jgi:signal transduction histidine kinase
LSNNVEREPLYVPGPGRHTSSELDIPLKIGDRTIGVLNVESERPDAFDESDIPYLEGLAGQLAQAIENARLAARARQLAAAEERTRMARDLHDETAQAFVAIGRQLDLVLLDLNEPRKAEARIEAIHHLVNSALEGVRRMSRNLRPAVLEDLGLVAALRAHADELRQLGLQVQVEVSGAPQPLQPEVAYAAFRVAQEALSNVARHAGVSEARLEVRWSEEALQLTVVDHGGGFGPDSPTGEGLVNMADRAADIGAELSVNSIVGRGTRVRLLVPLALTMLDAVT